jgi:hypothetical protein
MPGRRRSRRLEMKLRVVVRVDINEPGHDRVPVDVKHLPGAAHFSVRDPSHSCDAPVPYPDVGQIGRHTSAVDHTATAHHKVEGRISAHEHRLGTSGRSVLSATRRS